MSDEIPKCSECGGATVEYSGRGLDTQYKICGRWREPGHLSQDEAMAQVRKVRMANYPKSGRFA